MPPPKGVFRVSRRAAGQAGQALVEWILVLPLLTGLLFAVLIVAVLVNAKLAVAAAAREAARHYAVHGNPDLAACVAARTLSGTLLAGTVATCTPDQGGNPQWGQGPRCQLYLRTEPPGPSLPPVLCAFEIYSPVTSDTVEVRVSYWQHVFVPNLYRILGGAERLGSDVTGLEDRLPLASSSVFRREGD